MPLLIMMRHGESQWNQRNLFTGWVDVPLSKRGVDEALAAGEKIKELPVDIIFTTTLVRAQQTAFLAMCEHHSKKVPVVLHPGEGKLEEWGRIYGEKASQEIIPVVRCWELNERYYGELQGLDKDETRAKFGPEQVKIWRRSYDVCPPNGESLKLTAERSIPYFNEKVVPCLKKGQNVLISAHGNSLRSIMMVLDKLSQAQVLELEIPTGLPILYQFDSGIFTKHA